MKELEGKVFKVCHYTDMLYRARVYNMPIARVPIAEYVYVEKVYQHEDGQWMFIGTSSNVGDLNDRTVFLNYYDEVTDPAEIILFGPRNEKKAPSPTRGE